MTQARATQVLRVFCLLREWALLDSDSGIPVVMKSFRVVIAVALMLKSRVCRSIAAKDHVRERAT